MLRKLNLYRIPRYIRDTLQQLQDAYSEELDLDGSDTSSQGSTKPGDRRKTILKKGEGKYEYKRSEPRTKSQHSGAEQRSASGNTEQDDEEHEVNEEEGHKSNLEDEDYSEANPEVLNQYHVLVMSGPQPTKHLGC